MRGLMEELKLPPQQTFGDAPGKIFKIWKVHEHTKDLIDESQYGHFYSAESYIILYKYPVKQREESLIYFWQGRNSTINEKGTSAYLTVEVDSEEVGGEAKQIRVVQFQEPSYFFTVFNKRIVIHRGKREEHLELLDNSSFQNQKLIFLYQIHQHEFGFYVVQVDSHIRSFNSNDCYLLKIVQFNQETEKYETNIILWIGQASSSNLKEESEKIAQEFLPSEEENSNVITIEEGNENDLFWNSIPIGNYCKTIRNLTAKLFQCSNASGRFFVEPLFPFGQQDLNEDDMFVLEIDQLLFLWQGQNATVEEKKFSLKFCLDYMELLEKEKKDKKIGYFVESQKEPLEFINGFFRWQWSKQTTFLS